MSQTLIGIFVGATVTVVALAVQLWFSARQRERDRYMQLRRDVYLEAAEGIAGTVEYLYQNARTDVPFGTASPTKGRPGWLFKIYLVAATDTLIAFNEANAAVVAATLDVATYRLAVAQVDDEIAIVRTNIESMQRFQEEMRAQARSVDLDKPSERAVKQLEWVKEQLDQSWGHVQEEITKLKSLTSEHARRTRSLVERSMLLRVDVQKSVRAALLAARAELEIPFDGSRFEGAAATVDARMSSKVSELIALIEVNTD